MYFKDRIEGEKKMNEWYEGQPQAGLNIQQEEAREISTCRRLVKDDEMAKGALHCQIKHQVRHRPRAQQSKTITSEQF